MNRKIIQVLLAFGALGSAHASTEIAFVTDYSTTTNTYTIKRIDPYSGAYLGSFGDNFITGPMALAVDSKGTVYVGDTESGSGASINVAVIKKFNGMTGEFLGQVGNTYTNSFFSGFSIGPDNLLYASVTDRLIGGGGFLYRYNPQTGISSTLSLTGSINPSDVAYGLSNIYVTDKDKYYTINPNTFTVTGSGAMVNDASFLAFDYNRGNWYSGGGRAFLGLGAPSKSIYGFGLTLTTVNAMSTIADMAPGHSYMYAVGRNAANTAGVFTVYNQTTGNALRTFTTGSLNLPDRIAVYTAPEPGTLLACGLGLAGTVLRRKRR